MFEKIKAVIFDVDGTLVDSMWIWKQVDIDFLGRRDIPLPPALQSDIEGMSYTQTAAYFKERFQLPDSIEEIKEEWRQMADDFYSGTLNMKKGATAFIKHLHERGKKLGIATSNSEELVESMMKAHGLAGYFSTIRTSCQVPRSKPYPDVYLKAAEDLGLTPEECLVFEDTVAGVTAAKSAGMHVIAVYDDFSAPSKDKIMAMAEGYIEDFEEMLSLF